MLIDARLIQTFGMECLFNKEIETVKNMTTYSIFEIKFYYIVTYVLGYRLRNPFERR